MINVTRPERIGLIYTKYTCLYYGIYLLFYIRYAKFVYFIEYLMEFSISDDILDTILITDKKLLHYKLSQLSQILHVNIGFLKIIANTGLSLTSITISLHCHFNGKVIATEHFVGIKTVAIYCPPQYKCVG